MGEGIKIIIILLFISLLLFGVLGYFTYVESLECESVGGEFNSNEIKCYKQIDGKWVEGRTIKLDGKIRFVTRGGS